MAESDCELERADSELLKCSVSQLFGVFPPRLWINQIHFGLVDQKSRLRASSLKVIIAMVLSVDTLGIAFETPQFLFILPET